MAVSGRKRKAPADDATQGQKVAVSAKKQNVAKSAKKKPPGLVKTSRNNPIQTPLTRTKNNSARRGKSGKLAVMANPFVDGEFSSDHSSSHEVFSEVVYSDESSSDGEIDGGKDASKMAAAMNMFVYSPESSDNEIDGGDEVEENGDNEENAQNEQPSEPKQERATANENDKSKSDIKELDEPLFMKASEKHIALAIKSIAAAKGKEREVSDNCVKFHKEHNTAIFKENLRLSRDIEDRMAAKLQQSASNLAEVQAIAEERRQSVRLSLD